MIGLVEIVIINWSPRHSWSLPCIQYQMVEYSDTQGGYLPACSEPKNHPQVKTRVFYNSSYERPKSRVSETVQDPWLQSGNFQHEKIYYWKTCNSLCFHSYH